MVSVGRLASYHLKLRLRNLNLCSKRFQSSGLKETKPRYYPILLGFSAVASIAYLGAASAAISNPDFRDRFLEYAPLGKQALELMLTLENKATAESNDVNSVKARTEMLYQSATDYLNKLKAKLTSASSSLESKVKEAILTREVVKKLGKFTNDLKLIETDEDVVKNLINSIDQFVQSVNPETPHLSMENVAEYERVLASLRSLGLHLRDIRARSEAELAASKLEADTRIEAAIAKERFNGEVAGRKASQQLTEQLAVEKANLVSQLREELEAKLKQQADSLGRWWRRESRLVVDRERNRRLAKLDAALKQLKLLEDILIDTTQELTYTRKLRQLVCAVDALRSAIHGPVSRPFVEELRHLRYVGEGFPVAEAVVGTLDPEVARHGLPTLNDLVGRFEAVREEVRRAALVQEGAGIGGHMTSYVLSGLMFTKTGYVEGDDVEAILSRTHFRLTRGELESAARELNQLDGWPKKIALDWLHAAVSKLEFDQALKVLETEVLFENISHL